MLAGEWNSVWNLESLGVTITSPLTYGVTLGRPLNIPGSQLFFCEK